MPTSLRRRLDGEDGISLVEMLVAFVILGVVMSASAGFFMTAMVSLHQGESRTKATALANEELENLRALPWGDVGFYDDDFADPVPGGTVILDTARPPDARAPLPLETLPPRGGVVFTVRRSVVWVENTQTANEHDYKRVVVSVDWSDRGQDRSITVDSLRSPTPDDQPASDFVLSLLEVQPELVYIHADGTLDATRNDTLNLTALTSAEADFVVTRYIQRGQATETEQSLGSADFLNWSGALTDVHGQAFPNGDVIFTFVATRALPFEQEVLGTTLVRFLQPLAIVAVTQSVCVTDDQMPIGVNAEVEGLVEEDTVTVAWATGQADAGQVASTPRGSQVTATVPGGSLVAGDNPITVTGQRLSDGASVTVSTLLTVTHDPVC